MRSTMTAAMGLLALGTAGAAAQTYPSLLSPADPDKAGPRLRYAPVTAGLKRFGVVGPKDWVTLNRAVGPKALRGAGAGAAGDAR